MAIKKSELYSSLWAGADSLRGGMDASEYKNYVLNLLFLKYISDKARNDAKNNTISQIEVPQGCFYEDILALEGDKEIGDKLNKIIAEIAERNGLKGVIDSVDFNDNTKLGEGKAMIDTLSNLVKIFADLSLGAHGALDDDLLGDAYEYLMRHFASESGKSKGQFYTPSEVSLLLSLLLGIDENTRQDKSIYDPTCGSGSLLLKASSLVGKNGLTIYGQEKDISTTALCRMNMILHNSADADIAKGGSSTLSNPFFIKNGMLQTFDYVVANPPFSLKGFNQAWQKVRLGDIAEIVKGQQINKISLNNTDKYPVINGGIDFLGYTNKFNVSKNTIAISEGGTCGYVRFMTSNFWSGGHNYSLQKISNKVNNLCLYHILKSYEKDIMKLGVGSGLKNIQLKALKDFEIPLPPLNEQSAIASILSTLDNEIASLKNKKRQFENIKKALNHDLMSAKIRVLKK
ncbi:hypothetical protein JP0002_00660 [Helicobacter pylori]